MGGSNSQAEGEDGVRVLHSTTGTVHTLYIPLYKPVLLSGPCLLRRVPVLKVLRCTPGDSTAVHTLCTSHKLVFTGRSVCTEESLTQGISVYAEGQYTNCTSQHQNQFLGRSVC